MKRNIYINILSILCLIPLVVGCASSSPPKQDPDFSKSLKKYHGEGNKLDFAALFGKKKDKDAKSAPTVDDPEYQEYLEWKRWQEYKRFQEWKQKQGGDGTQSDDAVPAPPVSE